MPASASLSTTVTRLAADFRRPRMQDYTLGVQQKLPVRSGCVGDLCTYARRPAGDRAGQQLTGRAAVPARISAAGRQYVSGAVSAGVIRTAAGATVM